MLGYVNGCGGAMVAEVSYIMIGGGGRLHFLAIVLVDRDGGGSTSGCELCCLTVDLKVALFDLVMAVDFC